MRTGGMHHPCTPPVRYFAAPAHALRDTRRALIRKDLGSMSTRWRTHRSKIFAPADAGSDNSSKRPGRKAELPPPPSGPARSRSTTRLHDGAGTHASLYETNTANGLETRLRWPA